MCGTRYTYSAEAMTNTFCFGYRPGGVVTYRGRRLPRGIARCEEFLTPSRRCRACSGRVPRQADRVAQGPGAAVRGTRRNIGSGWRGMARNLTNRAGSAGMAGRAPPFRRESSRNRAHSRNDRTSAVALAPAAWTYERLTLRGDADALAISNRVRLSSGESFLRRCCKPSRGDKNHCDA